MDELVRHNLTLLAGFLILVSATVHVYVGIGELVAVAYADGGVLALGGLYLLGAAALYALVAGYLMGIVRPLHAYTAGAVLLTLYLLAYADWHVLGYTEAILPIESVGLDHDHSTHHDDQAHHGHDHDHGHAHDAHGHAELTGLDLLVQHLLDDTAALVAKVSEFVGAILLAVLAVVGSVDGS